MWRLLFLVGLSLIGFQSRSQTDTLHSPKKAAMLSAVLPSAGQFYNKKYWKMPIVYIGMGISTYFIIDNTKQYKKFRSEYIARINNDTLNFNPSLDVYADNELRTISDQYKQWRDISYISLGAIYILQIVDAVVDAHFFYWDKKINENISLRLSPQPNLTNHTMGFKLALKL